MTLPPAPVAGPTADERHFPIVLMGEAYWRGLLR
jgi:hypothetical protein